MQDSSLPPHVQLIQMATAHWVSQVIHVAAKLNLADLLANGPKDAPTLAATTQSHPSALYRILRALGNLGIVTEDAEGCFHLTPLGEAMKADAPGAAKASILTLASDWMSRGIIELPYSVETGKSGLEKALGMPIFEWMGQHPGAAALFSETMVGFHGQEPAAVAAAYDFTGFKTIVDVGGATGNLLCAVLGQSSTSHGILFDMAHVVKDAPALIASHGLTDRVQIEGGSFFDQVPAGGDAYLLSHVIHDWSEEQCLVILNNCRKAMKPGARLLIIEMVLPSDNTPHPGKMLDIMMLVGPGGQERTAEEYGVLLSKVGFKLNKVVPTASAVSLVEAVVE